MYAFNVPFESHPVLNTPKNKGLILKNKFCRNTFKDFDAWLEVLSEFVTGHNCACSIGLGTFQLRCKYAGANSFSASKQALNLSNNLRHLNINGRSIDDVLGIQTRGRRMVGPDKSTKLLRPQNFLRHLGYSKISFAVLVPTYLPT